MAGYNGYSKSNNAVAAEAAGRLPATALAKRLKCHSRAIAELLTALDEMDDIAIEELERYDAERECRDS